MQKSRLSFAAMAAAALGLFGIGAEFAAGAFKPPRIRTRNRYPEQSSRQAMRGHRRAQGGPGIKLVEGQYVARA